MKTLIVSNHKVLADFVRMIKGTNNIPQKSSVSAEDVKGRKVYSDHGLSDDHLDSIGFMYKVETVKWVNLSRCKLIDFMCAVPSVEPIIPDNRAEDLQYIEEAKKGALSKDKVREIYLEKTNSLEIKAEELAEHVKKARERVGRVKITSN